MKRFPVQLKHNFSSHFKQVSSIIGFQKYRDLRPMGSTYAIEAQDSALIAARKIILVEVSNIERCAVDVVNRPDTDPLHDLRISIRKTRAALKFFAAYLNGTSVDFIGQKLGDINRALGPARDFDAWLEYLQSERIQRVLAGNPAYEAYVAELTNERAERLPELCFLLSANYNQEFKEVLQSFTESELPNVIQNRQSPAFSSFANKRILKLLNKIRQFPQLDPSSEEELLHNIRKTCRRARHWAEFSATENKREMAALARHFKGIATSLGTTRDMQMHVNDFASSTISLPEELLTWHKEMEQRAWKKYRKLWEKLTSSEYHQKIKQALKNGS